MVLWLKSTPYSFLIFTPVHFVCFCLHLQLSENINPTHFPSLNSGISLSDVPACTFGSVRGMRGARMPGPRGVESAFPSCPPQQVRPAMRVYPCRAENCHLQSSIRCKLLFHFLPLSLSTHGCTPRGVGGIERKRCWSGWRDSAIFSVCFST